MFSVINRILLTLAAAMCLFATSSGVVEAKERNWYKYENAHFEAYSDGSDRVTSDLLKELENFRAAVLQVVDIQVPQGTPKAQVFIFKSEKDFDELIGSNRIAGFALAAKGIPYMAIYVDRHSEYRKIALRHEYAHVLLRYKGIRYPRWFQEGFAELFSATRFRKRDTEFTIGGTAGRIASTDSHFPWAELISENFNPHSQGVVRVDQAYFQSWLLVHYFLLGNESGNALTLARYMHLVIKGVPSVEAFESVVGQTADQFGKRLMRTYARRGMKYVAFKLQQSGVDYEFTRRNALQDEVQPVLENFRGLFRDE